MRYWQECSRGAAATETLQGDAAMIPNALPGYAQRPDRELQPDRSLALAALHASQGLALQWRLVLASSSLLEAALSLI